MYPHQVRHEGITYRPLVGVPGVGSTGHGGHDQSSKAANFWSSWILFDISQALLADFFDIFCHFQEFPRTSACRGLRIGFGGGPGVLEPFGGSEGSRGSGRFRRVRRKVSDVRCLEFWRWRFKRFASCRRTFVPQPAVGESAKHLPFKGLRIFEFCIISWLVVSDTFIFTPIWGRFPIWNHQLVSFWVIFLCSR